MRLGLARRVPSRAGSLRGHPPSTTANAMSTTSAERFTLPPWLFSDRWPQRHGHVVKYPSKISVLAAGLVWEE